jgi:hypothetical protein
MIKRMLEEDFLYDSALVEWEDFSLGSNYSGYTISPEEAKGDVYLSSPCWENRAIGVNEPLHDEHESISSICCDPDTAQKIKFDTRSTRRRKNLIAMKHADELIRSMIELEISMKGRNISASAKKLSKQQHEMETKASHTTIQSKEQDCEILSHPRKGKLLEILEALEQQLSTKEYSEIPVDIDEYRSEKEIHNRRRSLHEYTVPFEELAPLGESRHFNLNRSDRSDSKTEQEETFVEVATRQSLSKNNVQQIDLETEVKSDTRIHYSQREQDRTTFVDADPCQDKVLDFLARSRSVIQQSQRIREKASKKAIFEGINNSNKEKEKRLKMSSQCRQRIREAHKNHRLSKVPAQENTQKSYFLEYEKKTALFQAQKTKKRQSFRSPKVSGWKSFGLLEESDSLSSS